MKKAPEYAADVLIYEDRAKAGLLLAEKAATLEDAAHFVGAAQVNATLAVAQANMAMAAAMRAAGAAFP